ncbi:MAG: VOC family protein [Chloroflexota bacterium]
MLDCHRRGNRRAGAPGSVHGLQMVVADVHAAHDQLVERGVEVGEVQDLGWGSFIFFKDPDGNSWAIQQLPPRPPV